MRYGHPASHIQAAEVLRSASFPPQPELSLCSMNSACSLPSTPREPDANSAMNCSSQSVSEQSEHPSFADQIGSTYLTLDATGTVVAVNLSGITALGYPATTVIGHPLSQIVVVEEALALQAWLDRSLQNETPPAVFHLLKSDGSVIAVETTLQPWAGSGESLRLMVCSPLQPPILQSQVWRHWTANGFPIAGFLADRTGHYLYASDRYCELVGVVPAEVQGNNWKQTIHRDDCAAVEAAWQNAVQNSLPFQTEYRLSKPSSSVAWVLVQAIAERDAAGTVIGYVGSLTDITDRKQAEESLRQQAERERLLRTIAQHVRQSLDLKQILLTAVTEVRQVLQADRVLIYRLFEGGGSITAEAVSSNCSSIQTLTPEDWLAQTGDFITWHGKVSIMSDIAQRDPDDSPANLATTLQQLNVRAEVLVPIHKSGSLWGGLITHQCQPRQWQPWEIDLLEEMAVQIEFAIQQAELYQQIQRLNANLERQIHARTAQLQLAFEFEATLKRITDKVRDSLDEDQILQAAVQELAQAIGVSGCNASLYDLEQGTSTIRYEYTTTVAPSQGRVAQISAYPELYGQLFQGQSFQFCSLLHHPRRGRVAMLSSPVMDDQGVIGDLWLINHQYYAFSEQDIWLVEQVATQCAIAVRQARLYQAAQAQVQALEKLNQLKDDFLSTVSHELRTPISSIKMATQMLEIVLFGGAAGKTRNNPPEKSSQRSEADEQPPHPSAALACFPLNPASCQKAFHYFQILRAECQREINLINDLLDLSRLDGGTELLERTRIDLASWLTGLMQPFIDRTRDHDQRLKLELAADLAPIFSDRSQLERIVTELLNNACKYTPAHEEIILAVAIESDRLKLKVQNSGVEISLSEQAHIFEKFYRIPNHDPWQHGGTGLGLALVKKLVEHLGGQITVQSGANRTCFQLELPIELN
jgi:PAS domain S-box-containing protein